MFKQKLLVTSGIWSPEEMLKNGLGQEVVAEVNTKVSVLDEITGESEHKEDRRQLGSTCVQGMSTR